MSLCRLQLPDPRLLKSIFLALYLVYDQVLGLKISHHLFDHSSLILRYGKAGEDRSRVKMVFPFVGLSL